MAYAGCSFLLAALASSWVNTDMNFNLLPVPLEAAAPIDGVELFERDGVQMMVVSGGTLSVLDTQRARLTPEMELDSSGGWDARWVEGGFATVFTQPGSAVSWIMSRNSGAPVATRVNPEAFAVYLQPRFVRGAVEGVPLTAVKQENGSSHVLLFSRDPRTRALLTRSLGDSFPAILDARLLRDGDGYTLFTLAQPPDLGGSAGVLTAQRFDAHLNAQGAAERVLGNRPLHEFSIAQASNGEFAIFATTPAGFAYARIKLGRTPLPRPSWIETAHDGTLSSPTLLIHNGSVFIAVVENAREPGARVLRGHISD